MQATFPVVGAGILMDRGQLGVFHVATLGLQKRVLVFFLISSCVHQWVSKRIGPKQTATTCADIRDLSSGHHMVCPARYFLCLVMV